jgi:hypothetical protein
MPLCLRACPLPVCVGRCVSSCFAKACGAVCVCVCVCVRACVRLPGAARWRQWYLGVLKGHIGDLVAQRAPGLQNVVMQLRKACNHPYLFPGAEPTPFAEGDHIWQACGKMALLERLLTRLRAGGHKVLLFSQSTAMLDILQDYLAFKHWPYERLDGSVRRWGR